MNLTAIEELAENVIDLDKRFPDIFELVFDDKEVKDFIIALNTEVQLLQQGIDGTGTKLSKIGGPYADSTVRRKGGDRDTVTLKDTGAFYDTFEVFIEGSVILIVANTIKEGVDLRERWGVNIVGLTDDSISQLQDFIKERFIRAVKAEIFRGL